MYAYIRAIDYYLPPNTFSNEDYFQLFPELASNKNLAKIGVENRHIVGDGMTASDMAVSAAEKLFEAGAVDRSEIDYVLFCAQEFDYYTPTTACLIQDRLGLPKSCGALDYNLGCSGFVYGLQMAKGLIVGTGVKNVLLLTSSSLTRTVNEKDRSSRFIFGDGACATVISASEENEGIGHFEIGTDGSRGERIIIRDGRARSALTPESDLPIEDEFGNITSHSTFYMDGTAVFIFGMREVPKMVAKLLEKHQCSLDDIDVFIFHQANEFMIESIRKKIGIPSEKFMVYMKDIGNTVSSTLPIAMLEAERAGRLKRGDRVLLAAFGGGLSWSGTILQY